MPIPPHNCRKCGALMVCDQNEFMGRAWRCPVCEHREEIHFDGPHDEKRKDAS